jgi:outer membrane protein assembly factor BamD (BamD/ComL family)
MKRIHSLILLTVILLAACQSTDIEIDENMTPGEFFKEAQSASTDFKDYKKALLYYNTFIERYPNEPLLVIEAEYEIAMLYYKLNDHKTALRLFNGIIDRYQLPEAAILPAWPQILSNKMIGIIEDKAAKEAAAATAE